MREEYRNLISGNASEGVKMKSSVELKEEDSEER